jgi:hypothetical protein
MGWGVAHRTYHVPLVRINLTQNISSNVPGMLQQVEEGLQYGFGSPRDWVEVPLYDIIAKIVAKVSNRAFSGMQLCQNEEHLQNAMDYARDVVISAELIRPFPNWLKPILVKFTPIGLRKRRAIKIMGPIVQRRLTKDYKEGEKPDDMIQWLVDAAPPIERTVPQIVERIMALNVASIHSTTMVESSFFRSAGMLITTRLLHQPCTLSEQNGKSTLSHCEKKYGNTAKMTKSRSKRSPSSSRWTASSAKADVITIPD